MARDYQMKWKTLRLAFIHTIPVLMGYMFLGAAFGILLESKGYHFGWALLMSLLIYAGSMQFVAVELLSAGVNFWIAILMTLMINARHLFYGLSMLDKYKNMGKKKPYMIFSLTDETFSLICSANVPEGIDKDRFYFFVSLLDQLYWVTGSVIGGLIGTVLPFDAKGIDFAMTALFVVIFVDQWKSSGDHIPAVTGICCSLLCLILFGADNFILPSMIVILVLLTVFRKPIERRNEA